MLLLTGILTLAIIFDLVGKKKRCIAIVLSLTSGMKNYFVAKIIFFRKCFSFYNFIRNFLFERRKLISAYWFWETTVLYFDMRNNVKISPKKNKSHFPN